MTKRNQKTKIPGEIWILAQDGMKKELERLSLSINQITISEFGNREFKLNSIKTYKRQYNVARHFFCLIGDYQSLLMLENKKITTSDGIDFCPSMSANSLAMLVR